MIYIVKIKPDKPDGNIIEKGFPTELLALRFIYRYCMENHRYIGDVFLTTVEK